MIANKWTAGLLGLSTPTRSGPRGTSKCSMDLALRSGCVRSTHTGCVGSLTATGAACRGISDGRMWGIPGTRYSNWRSSRGLAGFWMGTGAQMAGMPQGVGCGRHGRASAWALCAPPPYSHRPEKPRVKDAPYARTDANSPWPWCQGRNALTRPQFLCAMRCPLRSSEGV